MASEAPSPNGGGASRRSGSTAGRGPRERGQTRGPRRHERFGNAGARPGAVGSAGAGGGQAAGRKPRAPYPMAPERTLSRRSQLAATYTAMVSGATTRNGTATTPVA